MTALSRREMLRASLLSGAGLFVAFHIPRKARAAAQPPAKPLPDPNAFVRVAWPFESVTIPETRNKRPDMTRISMPGVSAPARVRTRWADASSAVPG